MQTPDVLAGELVQLRKITEEDLDELWTLTYNEDHPEWKKWDAPYSSIKKVNLEKFKEQMSNLIQQGFDRKYLIKVNDETIGMVNYYWEHESSKWLEVGLNMYQPEYWNGDYSTEALKIWIQHLFDTFSIPRIGFTTWSGNVRMIAVGNQLGMVEEARVRKCRLYNGKYYDLIKMGLLREEWDEIHK